MLRRALKFARERRRETGGARYLGTPPEQHKVRYEEFEAALWRLLFACALGETTERLPAFRRSAIASAHHQPGTTRRPRPGLTSELPPNASPMPVPSKFLQGLTRLFSPYQLNLFNINPLRTIIRNDPRAAPIY
jgi:hypothetical protein